MGQKLDWLPSATFLLFGGLFFYASMNIQSFGGGNGARLIPMTTSGLVASLAALLLLHRRFRKEESSSTPIIAKEFLLYSGPLIALMAVYALFHNWFGYLVATFLCGLAAFKLFSNSWVSSVLHATAATLVLYFAFVTLLGVYDPAGRLIDFSALF